MSSPSFQYVSILATPCLHRKSYVEGDLTQKVFQASLDILGIVIYATEFLLWCGIFACGGYFNFGPWLRQMMSQRSTRRPQTPENSGPQPQALEGGTSRDVSLHSVTSSISVFRTPSSVHSHVMASELSDLERSERRS
jgi:hypothetical protein